MCFFLPLKTVKYIKFSASFHCRHHSWKLLFFGSDEFSLYSLKELTKLRENEKLSALEVATNVESRTPNPVRKFADKNNLKIHKWPPNPCDFQSQFDAGIVVSFGHLIPKSLINYFPMGMLNVHASLLPRWRGASPIIHSIISGDTETGVSIMRINPHHFDTGNVVLQKSCLIGSNELMPALHERLGKLGASALVESIADLPQCLEKSVIQNEDLVTYAPRITTDIAIVRWQEQTAEQVYNLYRALVSVHVLRCSWHGQTVKLKQLSLPIHNQTSVPGQISWLKSTKQLTIGCKSGSVVVDLLSVGGKALRGIDFYNGYLSKRPESEWFFK